jgi:hypothetical protein
VRGDCAAGGAIHAPGVPGAPPLREDPNAQPSCGDERIVGGKQPTHMGNVDRTARSARTGGSGAASASSAAELLVLRVNSGGEPTRMGNARQDGSAGGGGGWPQRSQEAVVAWSARRAIRAGLGLSWCSATVVVDCIGRLLAGDDRKPSGRSDPLGRPGRRRRAGQHLPGARRSARRGGRSCMRSRPWPPGSGVRRPAKRPGPSSRGGSARTPGEGTTPHLVPSPALGISRDSVGSA